MEMSVAAKSAVKPKVLVVDDNPDFLDLCKRVMSKNYDVYLAFDGEEGIFMAQEILPAVVVLDMMMPGFSGNEVLEHMQRRGEVRGIPIVIMTAMHCSPHQKESLQACPSVFRFLEKTVPFVRLIEEVREAVSYGQARALV